MTGGFSKSLGGLMDFVVFSWAEGQFPDQERLARELHQLLKPGGPLFLTGPSLGPQKFWLDALLAQAEQAGFDITSRPRLRFSRAALLHKH